MNRTPPATLRTAEGTPGRQEFSLDPRRHHLNHGSYGAVPKRTIEHRSALSRELEANPFRWFEGLPERHASARSSLSAFVGAPAGEIAMVANASAGASAVLGSLTLQANDEVLVTDHVYGAVAMGVKRAARRWGSRVVVAAVPLEATADETLALLLNCVTTRTRLVVVDQISSATARAFPVAELANVLANRGITIVVDGAHALGILPTPALRAPHVVWISNLHKFACAPRGAAVLVAQGALADQLDPLIDSWGFDLPYPERFDRQGSVDTTGFLAAPHAIETMDALFGWERIRQYSAEFGEWAASTVSGSLAPLMDDSPRPPVGMPVPQQPLLRLPAGVAVDSPSARDLKDRLATFADCEVGVSTWRGRGFIRVSGHAYSETTEIEQFIERGVPIIASMRPPRRSR